MTPLTESLLQKYLIIKTAEAGLNALLARLHQVEYEQTCENYCKSIKEANELRVDILLRCTEVVKKHTTTEFTGRMVRDLSMQYKS